MGNILLPIGEVEIAPTRNAFLAWIYSAGIVEASEFSAHCSDKLYFSRLVEREAPEAAKFLPRTFGLAEFLENPALTEFVVKAAGGMDSGGQGIFTEAEFYAEIKKDSARFLGSGPECNPLTGLVSSGERYLVQEKLSGQELRLHTLESRVVRGATFTRWDTPWDKFLFAAAENALERFLHLLPARLTDKQAWSVDLIGTPETGFRLVEVNTNRGEAGHWSGDLSIPDTLAAYVNHLERHYGAEFLGEAGRQLRAGEANREKFLAKFGVAAVARHEALKQGLNSL